MKSSREFPVGAKRLPNSASEAPPKAKKDPTKPKRGLSAYFCFMREERPQLVASKPGLKIGDVAKLLAAKWGKIGPAEKEKYQEMADEDKSRYLREMKVWEAKQRGANGKVANGKAPAKKAKKPASEDEDEEEDEEDEDSE